MSGQGVERCHQRGVDPPGSDYRGEGSGEARAAERIPCVIFCAGVFGGDHRAMTCLMGDGLEMRSQDEAQETIHRRKSRESPPKRNGTSGEWSPPEKGIPELPHMWRHGPGVRSPGTICQNAARASHNPHLPEYCMSSHIIKPRLDGAVGCLGWFS